jgi:hypothetical protein
LLFPFFNIKKVEYENRVSNPTMMTFGGAVCYIGYLNCSVLVLT